MTRRAYDVATDFYSIYSTNGIRAEVSSNLIDPIDTRPGFGEMIEAIAANGCRTIIVETANRFAPDLMTGFQRLKADGIALIAADSPDCFTDDSPTVVLIRQFRARLLNSTRR